MSRGERWVRGRHGHGGRQRGLFGCCCRGCRHHAGGCLLMLVQACMGVYSCADRARGSDHVTTAIVRANCRCYVLLQPSQRALPGRPSRSHRIGRLPSGWLYVGHGAAHLRPATHRVSSQSTVWRRSAASLLLRALTWRLCCVDTIFWGIALCPRQTGASRRRGCGGMTDTTLFRDSARFHNNDVVCYGHGGLALPVTQTGR